MKAEGNFWNFYGTIERIVRERVVDEYGLITSNNQLKTLFALMKERARRHKMELLDYMKFLEESQEEQYVIINALLIGYTDFNRHPEQFRFYVEVLKSEFGSKSRALKVWSAACSSGEEPYSIAIWTIETLGKDYPFQILASDVNEIALDKARKGIYRKQKVDNLPDVFLKHIDVEKVKGGYILKVHDDVKEKVEFRNINLIKLDYPDDIFDFIFCRNVLIYMKPEWHEKIMKCLYRSLRKGGYLFTGNTEIFMGFKMPFKKLRAGVYRKED